MRSVLAAVVGREAPSMRTPLHLGQLASGIVVIWGDCAVFDRGSRVGLFAAREPRLNAHPQEPGLAANRD